LADEPRVPPRESSLRKASWGAAIAGALSVVLGLALVLSTSVEERLLSALPLISRDHPYVNDLSLLGYLVILVGVLLLLFARAAGHFQTGRNLINDDTMLAWVGGSLLVLAWGPIALIGHSGLVQGVRYWWLHDDAMISMRYGKNLAEGLGFVWNPGEQVEGYTNFLWTLIMGVIHLFPVPDASSSAWVLAVSVALSIASIPILIRLVRLLGGGTFAVICSVLAFIFGEAVIAYGLQGFETPMVSFLFVLSTYLVLLDARDQAVRWRTYLAIATMILVRGDALILSGVLYMIAIVLAPDRRRAIVCTLGSLALPVAHEIFRILYYGDPLPNTYYLKATNWSGKVSTGIGYVWDFMVRYALLVVAMVVLPLLARSKELILLAGGILVWTAYVAYVGGDVFLYARFFAPVLPVMCAIAFVGVARVPRIKGLPRALIGLLLLANVWVQPLVYKDLLFPDLVDTGNIDLGLTLREVTPEDAVVADMWAGSVFYFSERKGIDLLGKMDRHIARIDTVAGSNAPGHNKYDFSYSLGELKPDFLDANFILPVDESAMCRECEGHDALKGALYFHPLFQEHCLPYPVEVSTWRSVFACHWDST